MSPRPSKSLLTLLIDDRGGQVLDGDGKVLGFLPDTTPGPERRSAWAAALRSLVPTGAQVQLLLAHSALDIRCQEVPYLNPREQRDVAGRTVAAQGPEGHLAYAAVLDTDANADGGHVLWVAMHPREEMRDWNGALVAAGLSLVYALPLNRALMQSLDGFASVPKDHRILLAIDPGRDAHLIIFRGRSLQVARTFRLPEDDEDRDEVIFEEVNRLLQFYKQKNRQVGFGALLIMGVPQVSPPLQNRLQSSLRLTPSLLAPDLWPVIQEGLRLDRAHHGGLNLVPVEVQEALQRKVFKGIVWFSTLAMFSLLIISGLLFFKQEVDLKDQAEQSETFLALRLQQAAESDVAVQARLPLIRLRMAEKHQEEAMQSLARISSVLFEAPEGIQLEKVEVFEVPGEHLSHRFLVTGIAFTDGAFSVGPLAQYVQTVARTSGVHLAPVQDVNVSDRRGEGQNKVDERAITRFKLEGTAP